MISSATDGATATFANGAYTWGTTQWQFSGTKALTVICASVGGCAVNSTAGRTFNLPSTSSTKLYRFSGFAVNLGTTNQLLWSCPGGGCTNVITQLRIDNNTLTNTNANAGITPDILTIGENTAKQYVYGVIDHNTVNCTDSCYFMEWINITASFDPAPPAPPLGTVNNLFFEDNTVTIANMTNNGTGCVDHWGGSAVVFRHNNVTNCRIISHGVLHGGGPSNFEISDNIITWTSTSGVESGGFRSLHHQGSNTFIAFNNKINPFSAHDGDPAAFLHYRSWTAGSLCDGTNGGGFPDGNRAPTGTNHGYPCFRQPGRDVTGAYKPMYFWSNKWGDDNTKFDVGYDDTGGPTDNSAAQIINNREYFNAVSANAQSTSSSPFNGTTGMGFGTLANRPPTCTTSSEASFGGAAGVGYFATDQGPQGQLFTCSATNTWSLYYTPFTYPHPLVGSVATPTVSLSPTSLAFSGQITVGQSSSPLPITLTNTGTATLTIASITASAEFSQSNNCGASLAAALSCTINVTFTPTDQGARAGTITLVDNASGSPHTVPLTGTGVAPTIYRPTTFTDSGVVAVVNPTLAFDGDLTTFATGTADFSGGVIHPFTVVYKGFPVTIGTPLNAVLYLYNDSYNNGCDLGGEQAEYSLDGGTTWAQAWVGLTHGSQNAPLLEHIALPPSQQFSQVQARFGFASGGSGGSPCTLVTQMYEVWIQTGVTASIFQGGILFQGGNLIQ